MTQKHDLFTDLFYPACNRALMSLLRAVPLDMREACRFQASITRTLLPARDSPAYNTPEPLHKRVLKRLRNQVLKRL